jgi:opacity protein-like surface antigen
VRAEPECAHASNNDKVAVVTRFVVVAACLLLVPALALAQAEPAPEGYVPPGKREPEAPPPSPLKWHISVNARLAVPLATVPPDLAPVGYGGGVQVTRALLDIGRMRLGVGADFAYQRIPDSTVEFLAHTTFAALVVLDGIFGRVRPWLAAGAGLSVATYEKPALPPAMPQAIDSNPVLPLVQVGLGVDVEVTRNVDIGLAGEFDFTFSSLTVGAPPVQTFQPGLFSVRLGIGFRF